MDYDRTEIPAAYDRGRDHGPEVLDLWMRTLESHLNGRTVRTILDLGCGTGRFTEGLATRFNAAVIGLDPSWKMLARAREKRRVARVYYQRGRAEAIPIRSQSVDAILISMSLHHFTEPRVASNECRRVLREGGPVFVRTGTREQIEAYPYVPFFPHSRPILDEVLPDTAAVREMFERAGFRLSAYEVIPQTIAADWTAYADKLAAGGDSVLARLNRQELDAGLSALRSHAAVIDRAAVVEPIDLFVFA